MTINGIKEENSIDYLSVTEVYRGSIDTLQALHFGDLLCFIILQTAVWLTSKILMCYKQEEVLK